MKVKQILILAAVALAVRAGAETLTPDNYTRWRDYLAGPAPKGEEIPWRTRFWSGVVEAQRADRPILLWVMNGHPLACT